MYKCTMCHNNFSGEPEMQNACGSFCARCKETVRLRMIAGMKDRARAGSDTCIWCGIPMTQENTRPSKPNEAVCSTCQSRRDWILRAVRLSGHPAKYVARIEERERPLREQREAERASKPAETALEMETAPAKVESDRIQRLEQMMFRLMRELGVEQNEAAQS